MKKIKILEVCAGLNIGGAQAVAANIAKYADDSFQFYYLVYGRNEGEYESEILQRGNFVLHWDAPANHPLKYLTDLVKLMRREQFDAVHCHTMFSCGIVMLAAAIAKVPVRISHSHTIREEVPENLPRKIYRLAMRGLIRLCANEYLACGVEAGYALYGRRWFDRRGKVIPNGIDTSAYRYETKNREMIRTQYGVRERFVIGHVGHLVGVKNQSFLIDLMPRLRERCPAAVLLLFGEGEDRPRLEAAIRENQAGEYVRLMGNVSNIGQVLSALDVFVFPSLFEGTPLALIEAQANGLPCVISDTIPMDACLTDDVSRLPLSGPVEPWIDRILAARRTGDTDKTGILLTRYEDVRDSMNRIYAIFKKNRRGM